jgi:hypothetical protein
MSNNQPFNTNNSLAQPGPAAEGEVAELVEWLRSMRELAGEHNPEEQCRYSRVADLLERLAQPEPVEFTPIPCDQTTMMQVVQHEGRSILVPPQPEPVGLTDEALASFTAYFCRNYPGPDTIIHKPEWHAPRIFHAAADALARWGRPAITPIPVSERLPYDAECSDEGECWWFHAGAERWDLLPRPPLKWMEWSHWLPAHALPFPTP